MSNFEINTNFTIAILCSKHVNFFRHKRDQTYLQNIQLYPESQVKWNSFFTIICSMRLYGSKLINIALVEYDLSGKIHSFSSFLVRGHFASCCRLKMTPQLLTTQVMTNDGSVCKGHMTKLRKRELFLCRSVKITSSRETGPMVLWTTAFQCRPPQTTHW